MFINGNRINSEKSAFTILHSEQPKLHRVLAVLSATGLITSYITNKVPVHDVSLSLVAVGAVDFRGP